jgi:hypothetical protein
MSCAGFSIFVNKRKLWTRSPELTGRALFERIFSNWIVKILSIAAAVVLFIFNRVGSLEERFFGVPLQYTADDGFVVTDISVGSVRINIRGSGDEIFLVLEDDLEAYVDVTKHTNEGIFKSPVLLRRSGSAETVDIEMSVDPLEATVTLEQKVEKEVVVMPQLLGYPAVGYELVQDLVNPDVVLVTGPRSHLEPLERLESSAIDLTGRTADFVVRVPIQTDDELIIFIASPIVEVRGIIREVIVEKTFEAVSLQYNDLAGGFRLEEAEEYGSLKLSGPQLLVEALRANDLYFDVACGSLIVPGVFELPVSAVVPTGTSLLTFQPSFVSIQVVENPQTGGTQ